MTRKPAVPQIGQPVPVAEGLADVLRELGFRLDYERGGAAVYTRRPLPGARQTADLILLPDGSFKLYDGRYKRSGGGQGADQLREQVVP
jgi:hypothetical protein